MPVSLSGLDLPWLRKDRACEPGRYRYDADDGVIPARVAARKHRRPDRRGDVSVPYFMPDVDAVYGGAWQSIVDGKEISSRSNWREHNKRNGVIDVGDKFWSPDGDDIKTTQEKMGYDPSLIGSPDFFWGKDNSLTD
jgi:hypothetical protein